MALLRDRPYPSSHFLVDFGDGNAWSASAGFSEVIFPEFVIASAKRGPRAQTLPADSMVERQRTHLVLKRGAIGSLDLYGWWNKVRLGKRQGRTLKVHLRRRPGTRGRTVAPNVVFAYCRWCAETSVLIETLNLAFDRMEMQ